MKVIKAIAEISKNLAAEKLAGRRIAFVPTMGALHFGHLSLVQKAREIADVVVVSVFVNKTQFNDLGDYIKYPRQLEDDLQKLAAHGVNYVFAPEENEIYPLSSQNLSCKITVEKFVDCLCGAARAGHFDGVALIITKLFNIVQPHVALFGEKDFQQVLVIKNLVKDFNFATEIFSHKIIREASGLAMSSRNQRLSQSALVKAAGIFKILQEIGEEVAVVTKNLSEKSLEKQNQNLENEVANILQKKRQKLLAGGFEKIDYLEIRDEENLQLFSKNNCKNLRIFIAAHLGGVRLIDNLAI